MSSLGDAELEGPLDITQFISQKGLAYSSQRRQAQSFLVSSASNCKPFTSWPHREKEGWRCTGRGEKRGQVHRERRERRGQVHRKRRERRGQVH